MIPASNVSYLWNNVVLPRLGVAPYAWGGSFTPGSDTVGTDCSGAVSAELGALVNGPGMPWPRQFYTGTFAGVTPGQTGPFGGVPETAQLVCIASPGDAPADAAMIIAIRQEADPTDAHMICQVQGVTIEMGGNEIAPDGDELDYHTNLTNPNCNSIFDTSEFNQWFYLPGLDPATPPPPGLILNPPAPVPVLWGIDISNNNFGGPTSPNLASIPGFVAEVVKEGFSWIEAKVSEGSTFADPTWISIYQACQANGLQVVAYHYVDTSNPASQAQNCKAALNGANVGIMLDWESNGGDFNNYEAVWHAFTAAGLNIVLEYIPEWYWQQQGSPDLSAVNVKGLVSSNWVNGAGYASAIYPGDGWPGWNSYGNATPAILQFTSKAQVAGMSLDADAFRGSLDDLKALFGTGTPTGNGIFNMLTEAQQQDLYNWAMWTFAFLFGALTTNPGNVAPLPGSPTPVAASWPLKEPSAAGALATIETAVQSLGDDFSSTATGLAVLSKLAELNSILTTGN